MYGCRWAPKPGSPARSHTESATCLPPSPNTRLWMSNSAVGSYVCVCGSAWPVRIARCSVVLPQPAWPISMTRAPYAAMSPVTTISWKYFRIAGRPWRATAAGGRASGLSLSSRRSIRWSSQIDGLSDWMRFSLQSSCLRLRSLESEIGRKVIWLERRSSFSRLSSSPMAGLSSRSWLPWSVSDLRPRMREMSSGSAESLLLEAEKFLSERSLPKFATSLR
mmetsp:Transcript_51184/g.101860  ORF Transcript_51184/g.101860 Transcript_51184/m.101860 type:complete len:221 (+) Transcript_51184:302-964(+)